MADFIPIPLDQKVFQNVAETSLRRNSAAMENIYLNAAGGHTRFPGLKRRLKIEGEDGALFVADHRDDMILVSSTGRFYRVDQNYNYQNVTGVQLAGGLRPTFAKTEDELVIAAGGPMLRFAGHRTEILSRDAPIATHVGYAKGFLLANERNSGRFKYSNAGLWREWDPLNVFSADSSPDIVTALVVTPFLEIIVSGPSSVEQFERLLDGTSPFYNRWSVGEGLGYPYTMVPADNGLWFVNEKQEFVRASGQITKPQSKDVQRSLKKITDWTGAWASEVNIDGQNFMLLVMPEATNIYGTLGVTLVFDYQNLRWANLYGWDAERGVPGRWPGVSCHTVWAKNYVGGRGGVLYELDPDEFTNDGQVQRCLYRSAHFDQWGSVRIDQMRVRVARGDPQNGTTAPKFRLRMNKDNRIWTYWIERSLGKRGDKYMFVDYPALGSCNSFQIEYEVTDPCRWEFSNLKAVLTELGT